MEEWRDYPGYEGYYQVSSFGRVKSLARIVDHKHSGWTSVKERILQPAPHGRSGQKRWIVALSRDGKRITRHVHLLVLEAFIGPRPEGMEGCHNDGNPLNNRVENLRWDTQVNNQQDRIQHGTTNRGERNGQSKLTESQVLEIRALADTLTSAQLAEKFDITRYNISTIIKRKSWTNI